MLSRGVRMQVTPLLFLTAPVKLKIPPSLTWPLPLQRVRSRPVHCVVLTVYPSTTVCCASKQNCAPQHLIKVVRNSRCNSAHALTNGPSAARFVFCLTCRPPSGAIPRHNCLRLPLITHEQLTPL